MQDLQELAPVPVKAGHNIKGRNFANVRFAKLGAARGTELIAFTLSCLGSHGLNMKHHDRIIALYAMCSHTAKTNHRSALFKASVFLFRFLRTTPTPRTQQRDSVTSMVKTSGVGSPDGRRQWMSACSGLKSEAERSHLPLPSFKSPYLINPSSPSHIPTTWSFPRLIVH